ncbi:DUF6988 family protein [Stutzerimonas stutzeri]
MSIDNTPDSPAKRPDGCTHRGGNYWTLFTPGIWKVFHAVSHPHVPVAQLKEFKHYSWRPLSSYVHGGIHAVNRHGRGFPLELVCMQVRHSNGPLGLVGSLLLVMAGLSPEQQVMAKLFEEFEACFPPVSV